MYALKNSLREYKSKYILMRPSKYRSELYFLRVASTWADHFSELSTVIPSSLSLSESGIEVSPVWRLNLLWFKVGCLWIVETSMALVLPVCTTIPFLPHQPTVRFASMLKSSETPSTEVPVTLIVKSSAVCLVWFDVTQIWLSGSCLKVQLRITCSF